MKTINRRSLCAGLTALAASVLVPGCSGGAGLVPAPDPGLTFTANGSNINMAPFRPTETRVTLSPVTPEGLQGVGITLHNRTTPAVSQYRVLDFNFITRGKLRTGDEFTLNDTGLPGTSTVVYAEYFDGGARKALWDIQSGTARFLTVKGNRITVSLSNVHLVPVANIPGGNLATGSPILNGQFTFDIPAAQQQ